MTTFFGDEKSLLTSERIWPYFTQPTLFSVHTCCRDVSPGLFTLILGSVLAVCGLHASVKAQPEET